MDQPAPGAPGPAPAPGTEASQVVERRPMKRADRLIALGLAFVVVYVGVLLWYGPTRDTEAFPFFNWSLFSEVPDARQSDYTIRFTRVNGKQLARPVDFERSRAFLETAKLPQAYAVVQQLGRAVDGGDALRAALAEDLLERQWFGSLTQADYQIVRRRFDILERHRCQCFSAITVLAKTSMER